MRTNTQVYKYVITLHYNSLFFSVLGQRNKQILQNKTTANTSNNNNNKIKKDAHRMKFAYGNFEH
jgi:hypothetical protein